MRSPSEMDIVQIDITARCHLRCSNCTRGVAHYAKPWEMSLPQFDIAVRSMDGWYKPGNVLGIIGGEPTLHSEFEQIARAFMAMFGGPPTRNARQPIADMQQFVQERLFDRSNGRGLWTSLGPAFYKHFETIVECFSHFNTNTHESAGLHQAMWISRKDYCATTGTSDDEWVANRDKCWVQNMWSATINDRGSYFCEVAGTIDRLLYDGKHAWPVEQGWWQRTPDDFKDQIHLCDHCSLAQPCPSRVDAIERDIVSPSNLVQLEVVGSPAVRKGRVDVFDASFEEKRTIDTKDNYVGDGVRVSPENRDAHPKRLALVVTCLGRGEELWVTMDRNSVMFDDAVVATFDNETTHLSNHARTVSCPLDMESAFNKGRLINTAIESLKNPDWILLSDADIILHPDTGKFLRSHVLNPGCLYYTDRHDVTAADIDKPIGQVHGSISREPNGYFQLFNRRALAIRDRWPRVMSESFCSAGGIDSWFMQQWPADKRIHLPNIPVRHILHGTELGAGWNGAHSDRPCWRQIGMLTNRGLMLLPGATNNPRTMRVKLTDTKDARSTIVEPGQAWPVRTDADGLWFDGQHIGHCHIHVAAWSENA